MAGSIGLAVALIGMSGTTKLVLRSSKAPSLASSRPGGGKGGECGCECEHYKSAAITQQLHTSARTLREGLHDLRVGRLDTNSLANLRKTAHCRCQVTCRVVRKRSALKSGVLVSREFLKSQTVRVAYVDLFRGSANLSRRADHLSGRRPILGPQWQPSRPLAPFLRGQGEGEGHGGCECRCERSGIWVPVNNEEEWACASQKTRGVPCQRAGGEWCWWLTKRCTARGPMVYASHHRVDLAAGESGGVRHCS